MSWFEASVRWYALLVLATWALAPLVRLLCRRLADGGALVARPLALLGVVYPVWLVSSLGLLPYSTVGLWAVLLVGGVVGWVVVVRRRLVDGSWLRALVAAEVLSAAAFVGYLWLRGFTPDIFGTEKPMDAAFLASSARATTMPPPDPWFAGEPINYYYLGYLLHGAVARMAGVPATTGFNLALATTFAAAVTCAVGVGYDAVRPWLGRRLAAVAGGLAAVLLVLVGNLYAAFRLLRTPSETFAADWWDKEFGVGWRASRIVCDGARLENDCRTPATETINEFPFFSFLLGDLHPHLMALPFVVVALALALNLALRGREAGVSSRWEEGVTVGITGAVIGSLYAMNSWDFPTYLAVGVGSVIVGVGRGDRRRMGTALGIMVGAAVGAWLPFFLAFVPPTGAAATELPALLRRVPILPDLLTSVGPHFGERTSIGEFLTVFGVAYVVALGWIGGELLRRRRAGVAGPVPRSMVPVGLGLLLLAVMLPAPVLALCGVPLAGALALLRRGESASPRTVVTALFALGFALALVVEFVYVRDAFDDRMNTLFKVYYQVWTLWAVGTALAVVLLWHRGRRRGLARPVLAVLATVAVVAGMVYPVLASYRWTEEFAAWRGLDGVAYVGRQAPDELAAIRWLEANATPRDVLLEAAGCSYFPLGDVPFNRASAFGGVPTVIGWDNHERQWRNGRAVWMAEIARRGATVGDLFAEPDGVALAGYGVTLLFVGRYERERGDPSCEVAGPYPEVGDEGYPGSGWELAFGQGDVRIFRRGDGSDVASHRADR